MKPILIIINESNYAEKVREFTLVVDDYFLETKKTY